MALRILVVEDEEGLVLTLEDRLNSEGYSVTTRTDGPSGESEALSGGHDLVILDVMLPGRDGFQVCRNLRRRGCDLPVLMLTARGSTIDRVLGLRIGADDYLTKPFEMDELLARVHALLRRVVAKSAPDTVRAFGEFALDTRRQELLRGGRTIPLGAQEYRLLRYLVDNPARVITRDELLERVWEYESLTGTRTVDVHVAWLRRKLDEEDPPRHLITIRGRGYRFDP